MSLRGEGLERASAMSPTSIIGRPLIMGWLRGAGRFGFTPGLGEGVEGGAGGFWRGEGGVFEGCGGGEFLPGAQDAGGLGGYAGVVFGEGLDGCPDIVVGGGDDLVGVVEGALEGLGIIAVEINSSGAGEDVGFPV